MKPRIALLVFLALTVAAAITAPRAQSQAPAPAAAAPQTVKPNFTGDTIIYVSDFELDASNVTADQSGSNRPGIIERPRKREEHDPQAQAAKLVNTMSQSLVDDLKKAGYKVERVPPGGLPPKMGAWVHGVFTEVDEGNSRRRAVIGFGQGQASMDLYVTLTDLAQPDKPLYNAAQDAASKNKPGAVITMNPYVAAAKFVMEKNAPEKMVKKTAGEISAQVAAQMQSYGAMPKK
jgi:uncharacterized protein DUF4410